MGGGNIGDAVVWVQQWVRSTWSLGPRFEVALQGKMTVASICQRLAILVDIPFENLRTLVIPINTEVPLHELPNLNPTRYSVRQWYVRMLVCLVSHITALFCSSLYLPPRYCIYPPDVM